MDIMFGDCPSMRTAESVSRRPIGRQDIEGIIIHLDQIAPTISGALILATHPLVIKTHEKSIIYFVCRVLVG